MKEWSIRDLPYVTESELEEELRQYGVLFTERSIFAAIIQAEISHGNQVRDNGASYRYQHLFPVTLDVARFYAEQIGNPVPSSLVVGAILHDTVEDDPDMSLEYLDELFGKDVKEIVEPLTKVDWTKAHGETEWDKRRYVEMHRVETQLQNAPRESKIIKGFDRINNVKCLPTDDIYKSTRISVNTEKIFMPWLREAEPLIYNILAEEMYLLKDRFKDSVYELPERTV